MAVEKSVLIWCFGGERIEFKYGSGTKCLEVKQFLHEKGYFPPCEQLLRSGGVHVFADDELLDECLKGDPFMDMRPTEACRAKYLAILKPLEGQGFQVFKDALAELMAPPTAEEVALFEVDMFEALNINPEDDAIERYMKSFEDIADETYQIIKVYRHSCEAPVFEVAFERKNLHGYDLMAFVLDKITKACTDLGLKMPDTNDFRLTPKNSTKPIKLLDVIPETLTGVYFNVALKGGVKGREVVKNHVKKRAQSMQMNPDTFAQASQIVSRMTQTQEIAIDAFLKSMDLTDLKELSSSLEGSAPNSVKFSSVATFHPEMATIEGLIENLTSLKKQMTDKIADVAKKTCQVEGGIHKIEILKKKVAIVMAVKEAQSAPAVAPADVRMN